MCADSQLLSAATPQKGREVGCVLPGSGDLSEGQVGRGGWVSADGQQRPVTYLKGRSVRMAKGLGTHPSS